MIIPFHLPTNHILVYNGRPIRFEQHLGGGVLVFRYVDGDEELVRVAREDVASHGLTTIEWALREFRAGRLVDPGFDPTVITDRRARYLHLDRAACSSIDSKSPWRFDWADAAKADGHKRTEAAAKKFIAKTNDLGNKPKWRSLLRWMLLLDKYGGRIGALVNGSGRLLGQSQLSDLEDRLVHKWAMLYWRPAALHDYLAHKEDAAAMVVAEWDELKERGLPELGEDAPSAECVRERINSLECYSTWVTRYGRIKADKHFDPSGEPVPVSRPFERIFMDGTEYDHSVFWSEAMKVPQGTLKMKGVMAMCAFSQFVFPYRAFAGPYRPEHGMRALLNVMVPPSLSDEEIEENPDAALIYGIPSDVMIDRDRTLIPPRAVPGTIQITSTLELAEAYHSDAKAKLENYHKFVKAKLAEKVKGRILGPRVKYDLGYDPLKATEVTRAQYVDLVEQCRRDWNTKEKTSMGHRSPQDVMMAFIRS